MIKKNEKWVGDSQQLVYPSYSYWTLGYALSLQGAKKLLGKQKIVFFISFCDETIFVRILIHYFIN